MNDWFSVTQRLLVMNVIVALRERERLGTMKKWKLVGCSVIVKVVEVHIKGFLRGWVRISDLNLVHVALQSKFKIFAYI